MIFKSLKINKTLLLASFLFLSVFVFSSCDNEELSPEIEGDKVEAKKEKTRVASCPTYHQRLKDSLDLNNYKVIATSSSAESLNLLKKGQVEAVVAGRTLKPNEPDFNSIVLKDGVSFLAQKSQNIYLEDLNNYNFYTDLDSEVVEEKFSIEKIVEVDDVYDYLEIGIAVTSWGNTDYSKAEIVHLLEKNNTRVESSRQATFYYKNNSKNNIVIVNDIEKIFN